MLFGPPLQPAFDSAQLTYILSVIVPFIPAGRETPSQGNDLNEGDWMMDTRFAVLAIGKLLNQR